MDGNLKLGWFRGNQAPVKVRVKADNTHLSVILAGIVAKVERDKLMRKLAEKYPVYGWGTNVGYGTMEHREAIIKQGVTRWHRERFVATGMRRKNF